MYNYRAVYRYEQMGGFCLKKGRISALLPILVFLVLYLGLGITFEYIMKIPMGFYNVPIIVAFLASIFVASIQNRAVSFDEKLEIMAGGLADKNIITMLLIFLTAGVFVGVVGRSSAESVAYFMLSIIPERFSVVVLFIVACFVSTAMGTSVGTITLITPIAAAVSSASGFGLPLCVASVMGGAMFGDNLSFISDTTIAACNGQGCRMKDKFRENFLIAFPAAAVTLVIILIMSFNTEINGLVYNDYNLVQIIPYLLVLIGGIAGFNVFLVLITGIVSGMVIMTFTGQITAIGLITNMGSGVSGMFETCMVAVLVSAMCALIREYGGFDALLYGIKKVFKGKKAGQLGMGLLVGTMDIATANNTVAIVMANPIAKEMAEKNMAFSEKATQELHIFTEAVKEIVNTSFSAFKKEDVELAGTVEPLEEVIDDLNMELKTRHIRRLREGKCTIDLGFVHSDITTNYERIADHCSNIAVCLIQVKQEGFDTHEYLGTIKREDNEQFKKQYAVFEEKYRLP